MDSIKQQCLPALQLSWRKLFSNANQTPNSDLYTPNSNKPKTMRAEHAIFLLDDSR